MKKILTLLWALAVVTTANAFNFSKTVASGQTLYFTIVSGTTTVKVVPPSSMSWDGYNAPAGRLVIPSTVENEGVTYSVTAIDRMAFTGCNALEGVVVPGSVVTIGQRAFAEDTLLTSVVIEEGVRRIDMMAFNACTALDTIVLPTTLVRVAHAVFENTAYYNNQENWSQGMALMLGQWLIKEGNQVTGNVVVEEGIVGIANNAFLYCRDMDKVTLPTTLRYVGDGAFKDCYGLDTVRMMCTVPPSVSDDSFDGVEPLPVVAVPCSTATAYNATYWNHFTIVEDPCPVAIDEVEESDPVTVIVRQGGVFVRGVEGMMLTVFDMTGRKVCDVVHAEKEQHLPLPMAGIYVLLSSEGEAVKISYCR